LNQQVGIKVSIKFCYCDILICKRPKLGRDERLIL
jgi:hypothetical protein